MNLNLFFKAEKYLKSKRQDGAFLFRPKSQPQQQQTQTTTTKQYSRSKTTSAPNTPTALRKSDSTQQQSKFVLSFSVQPDTESEIETYHANIGLSTIFDVRKPSLCNFHSLTNFLF